MSEETVRAIADSTDAMAWISDVTGRRTWGSRGWLASTGRTTGEELGGGWAAAAHPEDRDGCLARVRTAVTAGTGVEMEYRLRHRSGAYRWVLDRGRR